MTRQGRSGTPLLVAVVLAALGVPFAALAAQIEARVVDAEGAGVALAVMLEVHDGQQIVYAREGLTDDAGAALWPDVPEGDGLSARVIATYDGAEYVSAVVALENGTGTLELTVFPVTREGRPLHLDTLHLIVQADEPGSLRVLQFMTVSNAGEAAFAGGPQLADGRTSGIVIPCRPPPRTSNPRPSERGGCAESRERAIRQRPHSRRTPVPAVGRQVAVTYDLLLTEGEVAVSLLIPYPTQSVSLLLGGAGARALTLESDQLHAEQPEMIGDQPYELWMTSALQPGTELTFTLAPQGMTLTPGQFGILAAAAGLLLAVAGSMLAGGSDQYRAEQRHVVLAAVAALDDSHAAGDISDGDYFHRRGRELDRLALLDVGKGATERVSG